MKIYLSLHALSLFTRLLLGLKLHNLVNLSIWREQCHLEILIAGPIYSEFLTFTLERKTTLIYTSVGFLIDHVAFFKDSNSSQAVVPELVKAS